MRCRVIAVPDGLLPSTGCVDRVQRQPHLDEPFAVGCRVNRCFSSLFLESCFRRSRQREACASLLRMTFLFLSIFGRKFWEDDIRMIRIIVFWSWGSHDAPSIVTGLFSGNDGPSIERGTASRRLVVCDSVALSDEAKVSLSTEISVLPASTRNTL